MAKVVELYFTKFCSELHLGLVGLYMEVVCVCVGELSIECLCVLMCLSSDSVFKCVIVFTSV